MKGDIGVLRVRPTVAERGKLLRQRASGEASSIKMNKKLKRGKPSLPKLKFMEEKK
jgi:hypothetical protein